MMPSKKKPMAFDSPMEEDQSGPEPEAPETSPADMKEDAAEGETPASEEETETLSLGMLGGRDVKPGDTIRLEVVSVSQDDGTVTVKPTGGQSGGVAGAAAAFNEDE